MSEELNHPIFYDEKQRRWKFFTRAVGLLGFALVIIVGTTIGSVLINPELPSLGLKPTSSLRQEYQPPSPFPSSSPPSYPEPSFQKARVGFFDGLLKSPPTEIATAMSASGAKEELIGFYVNWDYTSFLSLKENLSRLDRLIPEWLHLAKADGTVDLDDPVRQDDVLSFLREHRPGLPIIPMINNFNNHTKEWDSSKLTKMLGDPVARRRTIQNLLDFVRSNGFAGICIDFENVQRTSQSMLKMFMQELYAQFHSLGLEVIQTVALRDPSFDYRKGADFCDYLILMAYEEHWSNDKPGPVASQRWYSRNLRNRFAELPPQKCFIAIGSYGYDWKAHTNKGESVSFQEAIKTAQESEGQIAFDPEALNPTFDYYDDQDKLHHVWFLDGVTAFNQVKEGQQYHPRGFAVWRLGSEDPSIWPILDRRTKLDRTAAEILLSLPYSYDVDYQGEGEVSKASGALRSGVRKITYNEGTGFITGERVISYPSSYVITQWGGGDTKKIALTFDDGPNARFTPQVLDILRRYQVPATFFIIGLEAERNPEFLKRIMDEGHEIGNHTYTHPNIMEIPHWLLRLELNATERLLESRLGHRSLFFRPPYGEETFIAPDTPDQAGDLLHISKLGYYTVGMQIDPDDWNTPGVDEIVNTTIDKAVGGEGNIVLLHDGGGDRSQTVAALPRIIEGLRAHGFELVTVSSLLGISREAIMPPITNYERIIGRIGETGFLLLGWLSKSVYFFFIVGTVLCITRFLFVGGIALYGWKRKYHIPYSESYQPTVSVVVPAYNEKKVICKTIRALLSSTYPNFNIIVVDDGSNDGTYQSVVETFGHNPRVGAFTKANGGKAHALNYGIQQTSAEIVIAMDADTIFRPDTISKLVRHFADPLVGAVAGNAKVGNRINLLTYWQALEYITSQNLDRRAFDALNCINVVPGCVGAWRQELVLKAGGFTRDTLAEDADLTLRILRMGYRIPYEEEAVGLTEAPATVRAFLKQRFRWTYGTLQVVWKHRDALFRSQYGALGWFAIPNVLLLQIFFLLVSPVIDFLILWTFAWTVWQHYQHPAGFSPDSLKHVFVYCGLFLVIEFLASFIALLMEREEVWRLIIWQFFQRFLYRQLMYYIVFKSLLTAVQGRIVGWGKIERKATVQGIL
jgi:cellulose synthase/poly-beta-1,6-N-acetylglucosamine synthase-like glycosyltransferase/peptidoglycan/xylan/chitin deacetylase (PgdA/CDA1 family)